MNHVKVPVRLVQNPTQNPTCTKKVQPNTNVRIVTSTDSRSGISYPNSGVRVVLVDTHTQTSDLHYISRYANDEQNTTRFETGNIDDIELYTPLESIHQMWVFPEEGSWSVDQVHVRHANQHSTFHVNQVVGTDDCPALVLHDTEDTFNMKKYERAIQEYDTLKIKLLQTNLYLVAMGSFVYVGVQDFDSFRSFEAGGFLGLFYLFLLEQNTNLIGSSSKWYLGPLVSAPLRLFVVSYISIQYITSDDALILPYTIGFFMYKVAVYLTILFDFDST